MRKHLAAAGIALSTVVGGVALGATVFAPTVSSAQEASAPAATAAPSGDDSATCPPHDAQGPRGPRLEVVADAIGIDVSDLRTALQGGQSIADVAKANGVDVQTVIDAMVADAQTHLTQAVTDGKLTQAQADERLADAKDHITERVNSNEPPARPEGHRPPPPAESGDES